MTKIAFLISEIASDRTRRILDGAIKEAAARNVLLTVYPGRYLVSAGHEETAHPDFYQETAVFDYIDPKNADVMIVDVREICKDATAQKREKFLSSFPGIPLLALQETEGCAHVTQPDGARYEQLGENAVRDAVNMAHAEKETEKKEPEAEEESPISPAGRARREGSAMDILSRASHKLLHHSYYDDANPYDIIMTQALYFGVRYGALYIFDEALIHTEQNPWRRPEEMFLFSCVKKGKLSRLKEAKSVKSTDGVLQIAKDAAAHSFIANSLYLNDRQVGLFVMELTPKLIEPYVNSQFAALVTGAVRLIAGDQQLLRAQDEIIANKKAMDKDASVLERLGDEDYLTKRLNRRGFFSQAYDLLQKSFHEGTIAIVGYIDMDSIKSINEFFGREEGDKAVKKVADILTEVFGKEAVLGRIRGNEFAVLLVTRDEAKAEALKDEMAQQNMKLMRDAANAYIIHLQFSICAFRYDAHLSLKEMLAQTDDNLQKIRQM